MCGQRLCICKIVVAVVKSDVEKIILRLLESIPNEDSRREGLIKTPLRVAQAMDFVLSGYGKDPRQVLRSAVFAHESRQMVVVRDIEFYSLCEHHLLPFFGHVSIGYIPDGEVVGLSKLSRVVEIYARRLQIQERMTNEICNAISEGISNKGVIVRCEARHLCMQMRGVEKSDSVTVTLDATGCFASDAAMKQDFLSLLTKPEEKRD